MDSATALKELKQYQGTRKSAGDYYSQYEKETGATEASARQKELRETIRGTEAQLKGVGESVAGRTRGQLVTEAQRARLQNLESQPIAETLSGQQAAYSDVSSEYQNLLSQAGTRAGLAYQTDADKLAALEGTYNKLFAEEQAKKQQEQWLKEFEAARAEQAAQIAESQRQFNISQANARSQYAAQASLYNQQRADSEAAIKASEERAKAQQEAEARELAKLQSRAYATQASELKSSIPKYSSGNFLKDYGASIGKYGPLALIGKGWGW